MSVVFASSTCDLSAEILKKVDVDVINLPIIQNSKKCLYNVDKFDFAYYYQNKEISLNDSLYQKNLHSQFELALKSGQDVLFITPFAKYDMSYKLVRKEIKYFEPLYPDQHMEIVNCNNFSLGYGLIVYLAGIMNMHGENITEVIKYINLIKKRIKTIVVPSSTEVIKDQLKLVGGMIGYRPVLEVSNSEPKLMDNIKGKKKIISYLCNIAKNNINYDVPLCIMYGKDIEDGDLIFDSINNQNIPIIRSNINPFVLDKLGVDTLAICYCKKSKS